MAFLTTDNREHHRKYELATPYFGTAPDALLQGFAEASGIEIHVVSCTQQMLRSPGRLAPNIFFHSLLVPKIGWMRTGYQGSLQVTEKDCRKFGRTSFTDRARNAIVPSVPFFPVILTC